MNTLELVTTRSDGTVQRKPILRFPARLGLGQGGVVTFASEPVSTHLATIICARQRYFIVEHGTTNGIDIDGHRLRPQNLAEIVEGSRISMGAVTTVVHVIDEPLTGGTGTIFAGLLDRNDQTGVGSRRAILLSMNGPEAGHIHTIEIGDRQTEFSFGRSGSCHLTSSDPAVSVRHFVIRSDGKCCYLSDCKSRNGTLLGRKTSRRVRLLNDGDIISAGRTRFMFLEEKSVKYEYPDLGSESPRSDQSFSSHIILEPLGAGIIACSAVLAIISIFW